MFAHIKVPSRGQNFHIQLLHKSASTHCMSLFQESKLISFTQILTSDLRLNKQAQTLRHMQIQ